MTAQRIYLVQHGLAVDKADDAERPLSDAGISQTKAIAETLARSKIPVANIFHSGKLRASQTAELFAAALNISSPSAIAGLAPNDDVMLLAKTLKTNDALYIGHLPHLEKILAYLVSGNEDAGIIKFQNSAVVCLEKSDHRYQLQWYLSPELLI